VIASDVTDAGPEGGAGSSNMDTSAGGALRDGGVSLGAVADGGDDPAQPIAPEPQCQEHADCDDGAACNGEEQCVAGFCTAGDAVVCAPPDFDHCGAGCVEGVGCVVFPVDDDGDGFDSAACPGAAGDDCDDTNADVNPAATEVCDGVDNDCNGLLGHADGLALGGEVRTIEAWDRAVTAWSEADAGFKIVGGNAQGTTEVLFVGDLSVQGEADVPTQGLLTPPNPVYVYMDDLLVTPDGELTLGYTYADDGLDAFTLTIDAAGSVGPALPFADGRTMDIARLGAETIGVARTLVGDFLVGSVRPGAALQSVVVGNAGVSEQARIAAFGDGAAIAWHDTTGVNWSRITRPTAGGTDAGVVDALVASEPEFLSSLGTYPDITSHAQGYAITWRSPEGVNLLSVDAGGEVICGPVVAKIGNETAPSLFSQTVAYTPRGIHVLATAGSGDVTLLRFGDDCGLLESIPVGNGAESPLYPSIASGGGYVALVWTAMAVINQMGNTRSVVHTRVMRDVFCE